MRRFVNAAAVAVLLAPPATAQVWNGSFREAGVPTGLSLPTLGAAVADEPTAINTNPAGIGFVRRLNLQYFYEEGARRDDWATGVYAADSFSLLSLGLAFEWLGPAEVLPARFERTTFAAGLSDGRAWSLAGAWHWYSSRDPNLDDVGGWDVGLTWRPARWFSFGAALLGLDAYLGSVRLPARWDVGAATRFLQDRIILSADLIGDNGGSQGPGHLDFVGLGVGAELPAGLALTGQVQIPLSGAPGRHDPAALVSLAWNVGTVGATGGATTGPSGTGWLAGVRLSGEAYRAPEIPLDAAYLDLHEELSQRVPVFLPFLGEPDPWGALLRRLRQAKDDPTVGAVVLRIEDLSIGTGRAEELRSIVREIREKKPVLAYLVSGGQREYYLATAASRIASPPGATLLVNGLSATSYFLKDGLARLGVVVEAVQAGKYKSAPEPLTRTEPSPAAREETVAILDDVFSREVRAIADGRRLPEDRIRTLVDEGLFTAEAAKAAGLLDAVLWPDELEGWARRESGHGVRLRRGWRPDHERAAAHWGRPSVIAVIRVEGMIVQGDSRSALAGDPLTGAGSIAAEIRRAVADSEVRAIVLRIDSPGGDSLASDLVWREVVRARQKGKPVVASMGDLAASGGYLVAVGADAIVAEPSTLTGSIGVFALKPDLSGLLGKLLVHRDAEVRGDKAQILSLARPWSPAERRAVEGQIQAFYRSFVGRVAEGRRLSREEVERIAQGRVWTGREAFDRHLVDRIGSFEDAVNLARTRAGLGPRDFVELRRFDPSPPRGLLPLLAAGSDPSLSRALRALPEVRAALALSEMGPVLALPPPWVRPAE